EIISLDNYYGIESIEAPNKILVSGAGSLVNGVYTLSTNISYDYPTYFNEDETLKIYKDGYAYYLTSSDGIEWYYYNEDVSGFVPETGWIIDMGNSPEPTISTYIESSSSNSYIIES